MGTVKLSIWRLTLKRHQEEGPPKPPAKAKYKLGLERGRSMD